MRTSTSHAPATAGSPGVSSRRSCRPKANASSRLRERPRVPFRFPGSPDTRPGLTSRGRELVRACNRLGVVVDVSHLNLRGFFDVAALSDAPLVASHSNAHALCASTRNLTDDQVDAIGESG